LWADETGIKVQTIWVRHKRGFLADDILYKGNLQYRDKIYRKPGGAIKA
jgi:hypothetical protein